MALYFFDSSALMKRYVREQDSVWVRETIVS
jgi:predicted nucleic acid-binding protein